MWQASGTKTAKSMNHNNNNKPQMPTEITVGVLALQGAFHEHLLLLHQASTRLRQRNDTEVKWQFTQVRNRQQLEACDALIIPGGESTAVSLVAASSGLLEPLREFVKYDYWCFPLTSPVMHILERKLCLCESGKGARTETG